MRKYDKGLGCMATVLIMGIAVFLSLVLSRELWKSGLPDWLKVWLLHL